MTSPTARKAVTSLPDGSCSSEGTQMPITRKLVRFSPIALSVALLVAPISLAVPGAGPQPIQPPESPKPRPGVEVEVKYIDDSTMKLKLLDEKLELVTKYGILQVAV